MRRTGRRLEYREIEQYDFSFQVGQFAHISFHVTQGDVDNAGFHYFLLRNFQCFRLWLARVLHPLNYNIIKVLGTYGMRERIVEARSDSSETFHIIFIVQRIEYQVIIEFLEQGKVSGCRVGSSENIVHFDIFLVIVEQRCQTVFKYIMPHSVTA